MKPAHLKVYITALLLVLLLSCSSVPFGSMLRLASFDNNDLILIQAREVRVRLTFNNKIELATKNIKLVLRFEYKKDIEKEYTFSLDLLKKKKITSQQLWLFSPGLRHQYEFKIAESSIGSFKQYQREFLKLGKPQRYYWTVYYQLINKLKENQDISLDLELKLSPNDGYFYLLKGAEMH